MASRRLGWVFVVAAIATLSACGTPRTIEFDATTAPRDRQLGMDILITRVARSWRHIEVDFRLDARSTTTILEPILPQLTTVSMAMPVAGGPPSQTDTGNAAVRLVPPDAIQRLAVDGVAFRASFSGSGLGDAAGMRLIVFGALLQAPIRWSVLIPGEIESAKTPL